MTAKHQYLALAPNYWGSGPTADAARRNLRAAGFRDRRGFLVLRLDPAPAEIEVDPLHGPTLPQGTTKEIVEDRRLRRQKPTTPGDQDR